MSWHYTGTIWMSTKCQHCWNCVPLTPVTLCWYFPLATDVSKRFIGRDCFHTHCCCRGQPFCALWRHRSESTLFHVDFFRMFHIAFQESWKHFDWTDMFICAIQQINYACIVIIFLHLHQKLTFNRMSTPPCHEINVMTFDAEYHEFALWNGKPM